MKKEYRKYRNNYYKRLHLEITPVLFNGKSCISNFVIYYLKAIIICSNYGQENDGNDSFIIFLLIDLDMTP